MHVPSTHMRTRTQVRKLQMDHNQRVADLLELIQLEGLGETHARTRVQRV